MSHNAVTLSSNVKDRAGRSVGLDALANGVELGKHVVVFVPCQVLTQTLARRQRTLA